MSTFVKGNIACKKGVAPPNHLYSVSPHRKVRGNCIHTVSILYTLTTNVIPYGKIASIVVVPNILGIISAHI